ncbi:hypothetical protein [Streptomyces sp. NPDC057460]|uniref:hypothetical protein n=1 Tax=Streptomyces sp. NPDC057460 TaxID=3346141 RepID=UPI0036BE16D6
MTEVRSGWCAAVAVTVGEVTRGVLARIASSVKAQVRQVLRARIVLAADDGTGNAAIARRLRARSASGAVGSPNWVWRASRTLPARVGRAATAGHPRRARLAAHPHWHIHWTPPHASWLNQVELLSSALTHAVLRHGNFTSRIDMIEKMDTWMIQRNEHARPIRWTYDGTLLKEIA